MLRSRGCLRGGWIFLRNQLTFSGTAALTTCSGVSPGLVAAGPEPARSSPWPQAAVAPALVAVALAGLEGAAVALAAALAG